jgi:uncharacterized membrane protein YphA (DoxX/SURF4 family)
MNAWKSLRARNVEGDSAMATKREDKTMTDRTATPDMLRGKPGFPLIGLLIVQMIIGYEWLLSGIAKFAKGDFPSGLADQLAEAANAIGGWYASFLNNAIIPNAAAFGYIIETAEVLAGIALIVGPLIWILAWDRIPERLRIAALVLMVAAAAGGIFMAVNFHIANSGNHPWVVPDSSFDEGVDVDMLLTGIQAVITAAHIMFLSRLLQEGTGVVRMGLQARQPKYTGEKPAKS